MKKKTTSVKQPNFTFKLYGKRIIPKVRRRKKLIQDRAEMNEIEIEKTIAQ